MTFTFAVESVALLIISVTMLAQGNDQRWKSGGLWIARLLGMIVAGFTPYVIIYFLYYTGDCPAYLYAMLFASLATVLVTTPNGIPWWRLIIKGMPHYAENYTGPDRRWRVR